MQIDPEKKKLNIFFDAKIYIISYPLFPYGKP